MPQIAINVDESTFARITEYAVQRQISVSNWLENNIEQFLNIDTIHALPPDTQENLPEDIRRSQLAILFNESW
ncbi:hypothetical protein AGMMS50293_26670 [Spirochaetia bacterium]|nr:hypothetical protein AGMMS50293_26670 [Spirochaetia bacterium]